jgi:kynurenine formamidase
LPPAPVSTPPGDYIVASGLNDGSAVAVSPDALELDHLKRLVGRAWESSRGNPISFINTAIGVNQQAAQHVLTRHASKLIQVDSESTALKAKVADLEAHNKDLESRLAAIEELLRLK